MLQRLKRPQGARDLPGGGGEVKQLGAASEVTQSSMQRRRRQAGCVARRVGLQVHECSCAAARPLAERCNNNNTQAWMRRTDGDGG